MASKRKRTEARGGFEFSPPPITSLAVVGSDRRVPVRRAFCIGRNYYDHGIEMGGNPDREPPFFFCKPADAVVDTTTEDQIPYPSNTEKLHYECEMVLVLGTAGANMLPSDAKAMVWGYAVGVDLTRRDRQDEAKAMKRPWDVSKGFDFSGPIGAVTPVASLVHPYLFDRTSMQLFVNGEKRQDTTLGKMIWKVDEIIAEISKSFALEPGDVVFTGTPAGVGALKVGDKVEARVDGLAPCIFELVTQLAPLIPKMLAQRKGPALQQIDLNADCGEGFDDAGLLEYVTSANIACGGHAGTPESIAQTVRLAAAKGVRIGAHPSYPDREGFGRRALDTPSKELFDQVLWQVSALDGLCRAAGTRVTYIKPHGALYHSVMAGGEQGKAVELVAKHLGLPLLLMPRSPLATYGEGFAERAYDGEELRSRDKPGAVIHDAHEAAQQAIALAAHANIHSICVHGDSPNAVSVAREVRKALEEKFDLRPFCPSA